MIFDDIAKVMNKDTVRKISRKTGLSRNKTYRMASGLSFNLDYNAVFALEKMGYKIALVELNK